MDVMFYYQSSLIHLVISITSLKDKQGKHFYYNRILLSQDLIYESVVLFIFMLSQLII